MDLWTEFEGVTIDSAYSLNKLLQTEGRSAFFSTRNAKGESVLIRIIECHFDEDEILARWRGVQSLGHPNFLRIDSFGQFLIEEDGITAVYAVFERVDANLGQVLEKGRLSIADAAQIGLSVASALETLHTHGFVHEHIHPGTIYAIGESVRLRSDCIRETPEGEAGFSARRRDVHDLALVLMQVLQGMASVPSTSRDSLPPAPFDDIVRNGMSGEWGLAEIQGALTSLKPSSSAPQKGSATRIPPAPAPAASAVPRRASFSTGTPDSPTFDAATSQTGPRAEARFEPRPEPWPERTSSAKARARIPFPGPESKPFELSSLLSDFPHDRRRWIAAGAFLVIIALTGWIFLRGITHHAAATAASIPATQTAATVPSNAAPAPPHARTPQPASPAATRNGTEWRVVAFTYNRKDQAQKKVSSLTKKLPGLQTEIFSPNGHAPWLVTVGGALQKEDAYALARKARSLGLPADTYAQNYTPR
jgi:hypothetical protein